MLPVGALARNLILSLLALFGTLRMGVGLLAWRAAEALERPQYVVMRQLTDGVELRRYESYNVAETTIAAPTMREGSNAGFRTVRS